MSSQHHPPQSSDSTGPEFSPDDALDATLERLLLEDGARWRADTAPPMAPFARRVNAALREHRHSTQHTAENGVYSPQRPEKEQLMADRPVALPPRTAPQPPSRRRPGVWSTLIAVAAAIAVVATLVGVLHAISNARVAAPVATPTPNFAAHRHWTDVLQYTVDSHSGIAVSPLDPRIAYGSIYPSPGVETFARTSDGGATWTPLKLPTDDGGSNGGIAFSPLDPQTVFLTLLGDVLSDPHCPGYAIYNGLVPPPSGYYPCDFQYVSHDGGAHWSHVSFPWPDQSFVGYGGSFPVQVQGTTLFAKVTGNVVVDGGPHYEGVRLVSSTNGGSTWSAADSAIYAAGQVIENYTAIPGTTNLYAISLPQKTNFGQEKNVGLWSSEDDGAHWTRVGAAPFAEAVLTGTTLTPGGPTLYAVGLHPAPAGYPDGEEPIGIVESRDGGLSWTSVPSTGWPQGQAPNPYDIWSPTTLADGSLLLQFIDTSTSSMSFYAWRSGDTTWFPVTPLPSGSVNQVWLTSPANGPQSIWIVVKSSKSSRGNTYTVRQCVLQ